MDDDDVVGQVGEVLTRIRGGAAPGEVSIRVGGGRETYIAYAEGAIEAHSQVLVFNSRGNRAVDVMRWEMS